MPTVPRTGPVQEQGQQPDPVDIMMATAMMHDMGRLTAPEPSEEEKNNASSRLMPQRAPVDNQLMPQRRRPEKVYEMPTKAPKMAR